MNIRNNLVNYLFDKDYVVSMYDDYIYFFNYKYLDSFDERQIIVSLQGKVFVLSGESMIIVKMTKEELLIKGIIKEIKVNVNHE